MAEGETFTTPKASTSTSRHTTPANSHNTPRRSTPQHSTKRYNSTDATNKTIAWTVFVVFVSSAFLSILADVANRVFTDTAPPVDAQDGISDTSLSTEFSTDPLGNNTLDDTGTSDVDGADSGGTGDVDGGSNDTGDVKRSFTVAATGDILIHGAVAKAAKTSTGWDFAPMFSHVKPLLEAADLAICHLETPLSIDNTDLAYYPSFRVPRELADAIAYAGYNTCSLASNHATDAGTNGIIGTINGLDKVNVAHSGMTLPGERSSINMVKAGPAAVAHLSYTYGFNQRNNSSHLSNLIDVDTILKEAREAKVQGADFVVLSMHWGTEYITEPNTQQTELGSRLIASPDIDLILGHHAHVVQPIDKIGDEYIIYGMGNFISNQSPESCSRCPRGTQDGVIIHLVVSEDATTGDWAVSDIHHTPTWVDRDSSTYEILNASHASQNADAANIDAPAASILAQSAARTETALT